jgi:hypothetical protein
MLRLLLASFLFLVAGSSFAQTIPFDSSAWAIEGAVHHVMEYQGAEALFLKGASAELEAPAFTNGEIEFDIAFSAERGFAGVQWRIVDDVNAEIFYFRPHLSGMPDANQYTPVDNGLTSWQLYHGPAYSTPTRYRHNAWQHVKIVFNDQLADIYIDSEKPVLTVDLKREAAPGKVAIYSSGFSPAYFANFEYRALDDASIVGTPVEVDEAPPGTVTWWDVSSTFPEDTLFEVTTLPADFTSGLSWSGLGSRDGGITNLAEVARAGENANTVFARVTFNAESHGTEMLRFGYSDRVRVYLNGELLYVGNNGYMTRDYRYLGTIGLFDEVPLVVRPGENELLFAVSEDFGGWGVIAQFQNADLVSWADSPNPNDG